MDGAIDVYNIEYSSIKTITDLLRVIITSKFIRDFVIHNDILFVATDFGIIEFNIDDLYVQQSYIGLGNLDRGINLYFRYF